MGIEDRYQYDSVVMKTNEFYRESSVTKTQAPGEINSFLIVKSTALNLLLVLSKSMETEIDILTELHELVYFL